MSSELSILALYGLLVIVILLVQVLMALPQLWLAYLATARDEGRELTGGAARCLRSLDNSIVAMALFAPAILLLHVQGAFTETTLMLAQVFLIARAVYWVVYVAGIPWLRTLVWVAAFLCNAVLYLMAL